ncbi:MAG TPA: sigma-70 family RNA polymerase sigma factor [Bacteroidales bacterium]|jgi:RNA polymerase sigma-70 factor (ECF subfamily)|nr:sigma-70 family RNA polymerase sigma factor [Bacteroidales bacterium]OQB65005.1 MAG: RNA polymerase sigma factor CarQ [Bacteroidetes bacterium ADurb.Bin145]NMD03022.1 sigma-70 family RNA polymerase sigma factor [Bacteroidales bacterium]HOU01595.1 sigma-70 family RNA polymerase sigma factor [Bacteroidales bacterium]HQG62426.1 sigma-70 family RNA polymerase sigma factor [Bacteroidales bacterium]
MNKMIPDYELIQRFIKGDESCFEQLIHRHKNKVFAYISLYIRDQALAEDLFQDTFMKVIQSVKSGRYQDNGKFISWVMRIAHNLIIDHFRRIKQMNTVSNDDYDSDLFNSRKLAESTVEDNMIRKQIQKDVRKMISQLPDDQREVVILRHYAGLSFKEIADMTDVSINTALGRMRYALINMRKIMEEKKISLTLN